MRSASLTDDKRCATTTVVLFFDRVPDVGFLVLVVHECVALVIFARETLDASVVADDPPAVFIDAGDEVEVAVLFVVEPLFDGGG